MPRRIVGEGPEEATPRRSLTGKTKEEIADDALVGEAKDGDAEQTASASDTDLHFMAEALKLADHAASLGEVPVGCVIVFEDRIIGRGYNLRESNQDPIAHAEMLAIREAAQAIGSWRLEDCTLYVTLEPCPMCAGALVLSRIARCVYGCTDPKAGFVGTLADVSQFPGLNHHYPVTGGVLEDACRTRLQDFFRAVRAKKKARRDGRVV